MGVGKKLRLSGKGGVEGLRAESQDPTQGLYPVGSGCGQGPCGFRISRRYNPAGSSVPVRTTPQGNLQEGPLVAQRGQKD